MRITILWCVTILLVGWMFGRMENYMGKKLKIYEGILKIMDEYCGFCGMDCEGHRNDNTE